jgi:hypothetical protein
MTVKTPIAMVAVLLAVLAFSAASAFAAPVTEKPTVDSESVSNVTPFNATLEAKVTSGDEATEYAFEYAKKATEIGTVSATTLGMGTLPGNLEEQTAVPAETGDVLTPGTTYYYRAVATNGTGTEDGVVESFTTEALQAPMIASERVEGVTHTSAVLLASVDPEYQNTTFQFRFGPAPAYGLLAPAIPESMGGEDFGGDSEVGSNTAGEGLQLQPNTEYHYEAVATNATGTSEGLTSAPGDATFLTLPNPPIASTDEEASAVTTSTATISGSVNPAASGFPAQDDTKYSFQYGTTTSYGHQVSGLLDQVEAEACKIDLEKDETCPSESEAGEGVGAKGEQSNLVGLEPGTTYHYRIVASNLNNAEELNANHADEYGGNLHPQTTYGQDETFTTTATPPILSGVSVQGVTQSAATITGTLEAQGLPTRWELQLGSTPGRLGDQASGNTTGTIPLSLPVGSLSPGTTYYYSLTATNLNGSPPPDEGSFTTAAGAGGSQSPSGSLPAPIPYQTIAELEAKEAREDKSLPGGRGPNSKKSLTRAQKLQKALKVCRKQSKARRAGCEKSAQRRYGRVKVKQRKK